ncbi:MAG: NADH-quinone oxidoreductase subunit K [bacterium]
MLYLLTLLLFCIGLYAVLVKKNIIKIIIGIGIMEYSVNLLFVLVGFKEGATVPILSKGVKFLKMVDPLPQALILTAIVIGLAVTALMVAVAIRIYEKYGTFDMTKIRRLRG